MKKLLSLILALSIMLCAFISCGSPNGADEIDGTDRLTEAESDKKNDSDSEHVCREVIKAEVIDGYLWITYSDNVNTPVNVGRVLADNPEASALGFYLLSDGTYCAFGNNYKELETIDIPAEYNGRAVTRICGRAFEGAAKLKSINIPSSIDTIGMLAFSGCLSLQKIKIGDGVLNIDNTIFEGCNSLSEIEVSENNQFYKSVDGVLYDKSGRALVLYPMGRADTSFTIGNGVTTIKSGAFYGSINLTSLVVSDTVSKIEPNAFKNCAKLSQAQFDSKYEVFVGNDGFLVSEISNTEMAYYLTDKYVDDCWSIYNVEEDTVYTLCSVNLCDTMKIDQSGSNVILTIPAGTAITRVRKGTEWCKVTYGGATGYVVTEFLAMSADAVTFVEPTGVTTDEATGDKIYPTTKIVGSGNYKLRQVPVVDSHELEIVGQLKGGATVEVLEISKDNKWAKIKATTVGKLGPDGTYITSTYDQTGIGYILYQYLEMGAGSSSGGNN